MSENPKDCSICFHKLLSKPATTWCHECNQSLCADCTINHGFSNVSKLHTTIAIDGYLEIKNSFSVIDDKCKVHNEKYQLFCQSHEALLCLECLDDHANCKNVRSLSKLTKDLKESESLRDLRQILSDNEDNISVIKQSTEIYVKQIDEKTGELKEEVAGIRKKINEHLDKIEKNTMTRIDEMGTELSQTASGKLAEITTRSAQISDMRKQLDDIVEHGTETQLFLGLKTIENKCKEDEDYIQSCLGDEDSIAQKLPNISFPVKITDITGINEFGTVDENDRKEKLKITRSKSKQAQKVDPKPTSIQDVKAVLLHSFNTNGKDITGCDILPDGRIILSDYNPGRIIVAEKNTRFSYEIPLSPHVTPYDVHTIDDRTVAVACNNNVVIVDILDKRVKSAVPIIGQGYGLDLCEGLLLCCTSSTILSINISNARSTVVVGFSNHHCPYVAAFNSHKYITNYQDKSIECFDNKSKKIWAFKDSYILQYPWGVAVDHHGYVYVACRALHNVVVISPDGQTGRVLLTKDNGLSTPTGLHIDRTKKQLIVANKEKVVFKFCII